MSQFGRQGELQSGGLGLVLRRREHDEDERHDEDDPDDRERDRIDPPLLHESHDAHSSSSRFEKNRMSG